MEKQTHNQELRTLTFKELAERYPHQKSGCLVYKGDAKQIYMAYHTKKSRMSHRVFTKGQFILVDGRNFLIRKVQLCIRYKDVKDWAVISNLSAHNLILELKESGVRSDSAIYFKALGYE